jgi:hypothetical protein
MISIAADNLKATTGIFDASLGSRGNETSGRAIIARQREGDTANYHFIDNLTRSMRYCGRIIVDLIPKIYDTPRTIRIVGEDMADKVVFVNQLYQDETGLQQYHDLTVGKYDVIVNVGPSYTTKRAEAAEALLQFIQAYPAAAAATGDLIAKNMDFPGADSLSERLQKMVPPELLSDEERAKMQQSNEQQIAEMVRDLEGLMVKNKQLEQFVGELTNQLQVAQAENKNKDADRLAQIEQTIIKSNTEIEKQKIANQPDMMEAMAKIMEQLNYMRSRVDSLSGAETNPLPNVNRV